MCVCVCVRAHAGPWTHLANLNQASGTGNIEYKVRFEKKKKKIKYYILDVVFHIAGKKGVLSQPPRVRYNFGSVEEPPRFVHEWHLFPPILNFFYLLINKILEQKISEPWGSEILLMK